MFTTQDYWNAVSARRNGKTVKVRSTALMMLVRIGWQPCALGAAARRHLLASEGIIATPAGAAA